MQVRFIQDFDYTPSLRPQMTVAYLRGWSGLVKRECGEQAVAAGKAVELKPRGKQAKDGEAGEP